MAVLIMDVKGNGAYGVGDISNPDTKGLIYAFLAESAEDVNSLPTNTENANVAAGSTAVCGANSKKYYLSSTDEWTEY